MESETSMTTIKVMNQDMVKLDWFDGTNFTMWQDKMYFFLTTLKTFYVLESDLHALSELSDTYTFEIIA